MRLVDEGERVAFRGRFDIREGGEVVEAFAVDVVLPPDSPRGLPAVWEVGGRIPRVVDPHHVNAQDDSLCVLLPEAYWYTNPLGLTLPEYLEGPLRNHLAGQSMVLRGHDWPPGEWGHGSRGPLQFYEELFGVQGEDRLRPFLELLIGGGIDGRWLCPCGSERKLRKCHGKQVYLAQSRIPRALLQTIEVYLADTQRRAS